MQTELESKSISCRVVGSWRIVRGTVKKVSHMNDFNLGDHNMVSVVFMEKGGIMGCRQIQRREITRKEINSEVII